ncbi:MAG: VTT domain-containing protein [bacterium]|nr:VTT domain-containing protein [bacterium]
MELFGFDLEALIRSAGYAGLFAIIFAESGLFIGFFLPGDSLLFTAGFLASQGFLHIGVLAAGCFFAAVLGDNFGYAFGRRVGRRIFSREESLLFNPKNLARARQFYEEHGGKTLILARFIPGVRTFAPILAGVGEMRYRTFFAYNVTGAVLWAIGLTAAGYALGNTIPNPDRYLLPVVAGIIVISLLPALVGIIRDPERRAFFWRLATFRRRR